MVKLLGILVIAMVAAVAGAKAVRGVHVKDVIEKNFNIVYDEVRVRLQL